MPDPKKVLDFEEIAATFGYSLGIGALAVKRFALPAGRTGGRDKRRRPEKVEVAGDIKVTPRHYQRLCEKIAGKPEEHILAFLMLRSLKQARYSEVNHGHFGLAAPLYLHFTSPIRRYPDLIVHRLLKGPLLKSTELSVIANETSDAERRAQDAERELLEWKKVAFMADRVGDVYDALIVSVMKFGFFVELLELFVEGLVPLDMLDDDHYYYRDATREIVGSRTKRSFKLGARLKVRVERVDDVAHKVTFAPTAG
jgi:ribonuclease R